MRNRARLSVQQYTRGVLAGDRRILSQAITLTESALPSDQQLAVELIDRLLPHTGKAKRIGVTGVPGVGKSTFIETFGMHLVNEHQLKLAVLTIDPSSSLSKGSILGDKTRMEKLSAHPDAYIRPSAAGTTLGGVANATREAMLLCEAAGFDIILVETVGVGQSEIAVRNMVDFFLLMMLAGAGDELQGIKKGIMEMADALLINKADGDNLPASRRAQADYTSAVHLFQAGQYGWSPRVLLASSLSGLGIPEIWQCMEEYFDLLTTGDQLTRLRSRQRLHWFEEMLERLLLHKFYHQPHIQESIRKEKDRVTAGLTTPFAAAQRLVG